MGRIKFRAWINNIGAWADSLLVNADGGFVAYKDGRGSCNADLEQFSGLIDKNGKEIYEGDIYLSIYRAGSSGSIRGKSQERIKHVVKWDDRGRWYGQRIEQGRRYGYCHPNCELGESVEVIGNIHENPELLKGE